jgi:hypothetical protein
VGLRDPPERMGFLWDIGLIYALSNAISLLAAMQTYPLSVFLRSLRPTDRMQ